ncbi:MAG: aminotransferase class V-fold PLP-dependent enzyme, partial [Candidatus Aegiribacteria sp.]|nr:aminotransferase class V-fold PLP-dependent enzyme [Candidatus Aegiribacteria sp.]MBD3294784.1 aminotransferase class V-fold PLP-dependent enzyme [Candidatus Fermentibacteria bacterium]
STNLPGRKTSDYIRTQCERVAASFGGSAALFYYDADMANALTVLSAGRYMREKGRGGIIVSPFERYSVMSAVKKLAVTGSEVVHLEMDGTGRVDLDSLRSLINDEIGLAVVGLASGISGIVQPVDEMAEIIRTAGDIYFHSDAVSAAGRYPLDISLLGVDSIAISSPPLGGPSGAAAAVFASGQPVFTPEAYEFTVPGNLAEIAGMTAALKVMLNSMDSGIRIMNELRNDLLKNLDRSSIKFLLVGGDTGNILPGTGLLKLLTKIERLHARLESRGVMLPSHNSPERLSYLRRMGADCERADDYLGFSFSSRNTKVDVKHFERSLLEIYSTVGGQQI